ncbi:hypothetical protein HDV57DRAFT_518587 [Trichoderma longibrachiatum]
MSDQEDPDTAVMRGQRRYLEGWHEFIVKDQKLLVADGLSLIIFRPQSTGARWYGESTGKEGELVHQVTAVLNGQRRYIEGFHVFTIKDETSIVAEGEIQIYPRGDNNPRWAGEGTGPGGKPLQPGDRILVHNTIVEFKKT